MLVCWIDTERCDATIEDVKGTLQDYYRMTHCEAIDIATRTVEGTPFNIVVDDEGILRDDPKFSVYDMDGRPNLAGSVVVCGMADLEGNMTGLTEDDVDLLDSHLMLLMVEGERDRPILIVD